MTRAHVFSRALPVLAAAVLLPGIAPAQSPATGSTACYVPGSGTIYLVQQRDTPAECRAGHVPFSLTATGTVSPQFAGGNGGGGSLPTNGQGAYDFSNVNGFVAAGTWGSGNIPATGSGTRFMWYPRKGAIRVGIVTGNQWDDSNIGSTSAAVGYNTRAIGQYAFAAGTTALASGNAAVAMGDQSAATGAASAAVGQQAKADGLGAIALGREVWASGSGSVALGYLTIASGYAATALGGHSHATGDAAIAGGVGSKAMGDKSVALGDHNITSGTGAIAMGFESTASGFAAVALGQYVTASNDRATAFGYSTTASGFQSTVMGSKASTNGKTGAFVYGDASSATTVNAMANNQFVVRAQRIWLGNANTVLATAGRYLETSTGAYLSTGGAWVSSSDSTKKHHWQDVNGEEVLSRLTTLPVRTWSYREESDSVRHMGPTAQDFRTAFGLGDTDRAIAGIDADGVSLAGIKALIDRTNLLRRENAELREVLAEVYRRLAALEANRR